MKDFLAKPKNQKFKQKSLSLSIVLATCVFYAVAQTSFSSFSINAENDLLFSIRNKNSKGEFYETLFLKKDKNDTFEQLSFYPESMEVFAEGKILQISNKMGVITLSLQTNGDKELKSFTLFENDKFKQNYDSLQVSPTGRYISVVEPTDYVFGNLVLHDLKTGKKLFITDKILQKKQTILWAEDDSAFVFEKDKFIYFSRPTWLLEKKSEIKVKNEKAFTIVKVAETSIDAVKWRDNNNFYLVENSKVYMVNANKVLAYSIYETILQIKKQLADLPFEFFPQQDKIFYSKNSNSLLLLKDKTHLYFWQLDFFDKNFARKSSSVPYLLLPQQAKALQVLWQNEKPVIWFKTMTESKNEFYAWQIKNNAFVQIKLARDENILSLSPKANFALVETNKKYSIKNLNTGEKVFNLSAENLVSSAWLSDNVLVIGTDVALVKIDLQKSTSENLLLAQVQDFSWSSDGKKILAKLKNTDTVLENSSALNWLTSKEKLQTKKNYNDNYRLYVDKVGGVFSNMIYFRSRKDLGTFPLVKNFLENKITSEQQGNTKKIALIFDIMENSKGLDTVLFTLREKKTPATFFLTSEFINNEPTQAKKIVQSGQQCASLFLAPFNLSDSKYKVTKEFIQSGLARTEDIFYKATGAELSLFWHTPYYVISEDVRDLAKTAGYEFILPTIMLPDWVSQNTLSPALVQNSYELVNYIMENLKDGAIIPIQLGDLKNRDDYLYDRLNLLLELFENYGYVVAPLQEILNK
ncbi:MAG: polysaccharide deacetylase family protein [Treponemataceae bacterium]